MDLFKDLDSCSMDKRNEPDWRYPLDMAERVKRLELRWAILVAELPSARAAGADLPDPDRS